MTVRLAPPRMAPGSTVLIYGRRHTVQGFTRTGRSFLPADDSEAEPVEITFDRQIELIRQLKLTSDISYQTIPDSVRINLTRDLSVFGDVARMEATARFAYCRAIHELPWAHRDKSAHVGPALARVAETEIGKTIAQPSFRLAREWYNRWVGCAFDIRALIPSTSKRGNKEARYDDWVYAEIDKAILEVHANCTRGSISQTLKRARQLVRLKVDKEGRKLPGKSKHILGRGVVEDRIAKMGHYELVARQWDEKEARRQLRMIGAGPDGKYPLAEVEIDHTVIDLMVRHNDIVLGRPYITALIDRYSRMILGFTISFVPPSWVSVMEALRQAVMPKDALLNDVYEATGVSFEFDWPCWGAPDQLFVDQGAEFLSISMAAAEAALNMKLVQLSKARGDLKGKIESWFHSKNQQITHRIPGTTFSNPQKRKNADPKTFAIIGFDEFKTVVLRWVVDVHNAQEHSSTGQCPIKAWQEGMRKVGPKPPPPMELLSPLVGLVVQRRLLQSGVSYNRLRFNSIEFQALRARLPKNSRVEVRIDPLDLTQAYILDPDTLDWVVGHCVSEDSASKLTLAQYNFVRKASAEQKIVDEDYELKLARGEQKVRDAINGAHRRSGVPPKQIVALVTQGTRPSEHIHRNRTDPTESESRMGSHDFDGPVLSPAPDPAGPYREKVLMPVDPYPTKRSDGEPVGSWRPPATIPPLVEAAATEQPREERTFTGRRRV
ncbi:hypothetical protein ACFOWB_18340 [Chenggangzhangella methanolivorans]